MAKIFEIWNDHVRPSINELLDLGHIDYQFKDVYIDGIAYIDQLNIEFLLEMNDLDIISIGTLEGIDGNVFIEMGTDGRLSISADGTGTPFIDPDLDFTGSVFFDDDVGLATSKKLLFRDTELYMSSDDDGHLDLTTDQSIDLNGGVLVRRVTTATNYQLLVNDLYVGVTNTSVARTITLPVATTVGAGRIFIVKDESGGAGNSGTPITVASNSGETIDGAGTASINTNYGVSRIICTGTAWMTF